MFVSNLDQMEQIVSSQKNLFWDGWTVVERTPNKEAMMDPKGVFINGNWYIQKRFVPSRDGWKIPNKYVS